MLILGISAHCRDSAAALLRDGEIVAAAQEERFTRKMHDASFPVSAIKYCLQEAHVALADVDYIAFCGKSIVKFERLLETHRDHRPSGVGSLLKAMPIWLKEKVFLKAALKKEFAALGGLQEKKLPPFVFTAQHQAQPAAGGACGALDAALAIWYEYSGQHRNQLANNHSIDAAMHGGYFGPWFAPNSIAEYLDSIKAPYRIAGDAELMDELTALLAREKIVGWFQGRMEFGSRAMGARSIIGDPRSAKMQALMNLDIDNFDIDNLDVDGREPLHPFSAVIKAERAREWSERDCGSKRIAAPVRAETNPRLYRLLDKFEQKTGSPVLAHAAFKMRGEPIVCTPADAYRCFMRSDMDCLVLENIILHKNEQPLWEECAE